MTRAPVPTTCTRSSVSSLVRTPSRPSTRTWLPATVPASGPSTFSVLWRSRRPTTSAVPTSGSSLSPTSSSPSPTASPRLARPSLRTAQRPSKRAIWSGDLWSWLGLVRENHARRVLLRCGAAPRCMAPSCSLTHMHNDAMTHALVARFSVNYSCLFGCSQFTCMLDEMLEGLSRIQMEESAFTMFKCWSTFIVICAGIAFAHSTRRRDRFRGRALLNLSRHHGRTRSRRVCTAQQRRFTGAYTSCRPAASSDLQTASNQSRSSRSVAKRGASDRDGDVRIAVRQVPTHLRVAQEYLVSPPAALVVAFYPSVHFWPHSRASPR